MVSRAPFTCMPLPSLQGTAAPALRVHPCTPHTQLMRMILLRPAVAIF